MIYYFDDVLTRCFKIRQDVNICGIDDDFNVYLIVGPRPKNWDRPNFYWENSNYEISDSVLLISGKLKSRKLVEKDCGAYATKTQILIAEQLVKSDTVDKTVSSAAINVVGKAYSTLEMKRIPTGQLQVKNGDGLLYAIWKKEKGKRIKAGQERRVFQYCQERRKRKPFKDYVRIISSSQDIFCLSETAAARLCAYRFDRQKIEGTENLMSPSKYSEMIKFAKEHNISTDDFRLGKNLGTIEIKVQRFERDRTSFLKRIKESFYDDIRDGMLIVDFVLSNNQSE